MKVPALFGCLAGLLAPPVLAFLGGAAVTAAVAGGAAGPGPVAVGGGAATLPTGMLAVYVAAARDCPGLPWQVLAAVGTVESASGTSGLPGVRSGRNRAGAEGPMQFEPATFAAYARPVPPGGADPPSPYDPVDAVYAAARMLCADGGGRPATLGRALFDYNHSPAYVSLVLATAGALGLGLGRASSGPAGGDALAYALSQVGTPYRWGGEAPGVGFDCSGLTQAAYAAAGVAIPRVAEDQLRAGPVVPPGIPPAPGDLVFFGPAPGDATHVGLVVDPSGVMVDAPHTGATVRIDRFRPVTGAAWGTDFYLGATAPG